MCSSFLIRNSFQQSFVAFTFALVEVIETWYHPKKIGLMFSVFSFSNFYSTVHFTRFKIKKYLEHTIDVFGFI